MQRSASALAASNNDLSQSIALITTANTIAQDAQSVGTGLKTMALRLRSTKTEIEQLGEDAEGAAENVSKLREQVLALTKNKVDIQIDENTYKSSYDILLEISKVWNELNDMSKASLLEQLFGKRQANIGAAILENGDLLQEVYKTAEESIGSATKEQERFSQSIQYSINSFKAAYQSLASDVVGSKFVKELVDIGSEIIKGLDFIITKTGILQGILVGFGSLAIFKTIPALVNQVRTLGASLTAFGAIMNTLGASGGGGQVMTLQQLAMASKNLSNKQFELILSTKELTNAQLTAMMQARGFTQEQISAQIAIRNQTVATTGLSTAEKGATASTFSLSGALKGLGAAIAANPIGAIVTAITLLGVGISSLKRKHQEAIVEAKRLEEERINNLETTTNELKAFESEQDSIDGITKKYATLLNTTSDISSAKESLTGITNELNEKFGDEKSQIDLVNGSLSENIELIRQQQLELDKQWQRDNKNDIKEAQNFVSDHADDMPVFYRASGARLGENYDEAVKEAEFYFNRMKHLIDENDAELWKYFDTVEEVSTDRAGYMVQTYGFKLKEGLNEEVIPDVLKSFRNLYEQLEQYSYMNFKWFSGVGDADSLNQLISDWDKYSDIIRKDNEINNKFWDNTAIGADNTKKQFNALIDTASELSRKINDKSALPADIYIYTRELSDIRTQLEELAQNSPELQKRLELVFSTIGLQIEDVSESAELLNKKFFEVLDEMQKGVFDKVGKINDALVKMLSGEGLSSTEAWELLEMDTTGILTPLINANGEWIMQSEQLVTLKERLVRLSADQVRTDLKSAQEQVLDLDRQIAQQYAIIKEQEAIISQTRGNSKPNEDNITALRNAKSEVGRLLEVQKKYSEEVKKDNLLLQGLNNSLGLSVEQSRKLLENQQKQLNNELAALEKELDNYQKAHEARIDGVIEGLEAEREELERQETALENELNLLEEQKNSIDDIISKYDTVNSLVQKTIERDIKKLEDERDAIKDNYDARIKALQDENKEREDSLEYAQKLKNLENAQNNKVRVYDEARGWHWASNSDDVKKAQNELSEYENRKAIEQLEAERDALIDATEDIIDSRTKYADQWKEVSDDIQDEADEELAKEILGADWREKIANGDIKLLDDFATQYMSHNVKLRNLTNTEINLKKQAIDAKNAEIEAKSKQIESWQKYKTAVQTAAKTIKESSEDYMDIVRQLDREEPLTLENRGNAFENFKTRLTGYIDEIGQKQYLIDQMTSSIEQISGGSYDFSLNVDGLGELREAVELVKRLGLEYDAAAIGKYLFENGKNLNENEARNLLQAYADASTNLIGYSNGGVADYTGVAMLHGRKNAPETIFNAKDSAKLYELVHNTPNLMANMLNQVKGAIGKTGNVSNVMTSDRTNVVPSVSIGAISVYANNPQEFTKGLDQHLDRYFQRKLTASYTNR